MPDKLLVANHGARANLKLRVTIDGESRSLDLDEKGGCVQASAVGISGRQSVADQRGEGDSVAAQQKLMLLE